MKSGFTLIELLIGLAISSILAYSIFTIFNQVQRTSLLSERFVRNASSVLVFQHQFEKDISGAFVPKYWLKKEQSQQQEQSRAAENDKKAAAQTKEAAQKKEPAIDKVFVSQEEAGNIKELTFITCNPFQTYDNYKPRIARVQYTLVVQEDKTFNLIRKESSELDYAKFTAAKVPEFVILRSITAWRLEYFYPEQQDEKEQEKKKSAKATFKAVKEWPLPDNKGKDLPEIPQYAVLTCTVRDPNLLAEDSFEFRYQLFSFTQPKLENKEKAAQKPTQQDTDRAKNGMQQEKRPGARQSPLQQAFTQPASLDAFEAFMKGGR